MTSSNAERLTGEDKFGKFTLDLRIAEAFCDCCGHSTSVRVRYDVQTIRLPDGIKTSDTILHTPSHMGIGIVCGCYAKFHRQVTHIQERMKR
jgi:hypothetical protein